MTITSEWPLPKDGIRFMTPKFLVEFLAKHPLSRNLYPLATGYYPTATGHKLQRLKHHNHLLIYCTAGKGSLSAYNRTWRIKAGDLFLLPKGVAHEYRANRNTPWTIYWVHYAGSLAETYTVFINTETPVVHIGPQPRLITDFENLFALRHAGYAEAAFIHASGQLKQMLTGIASLVRTNKNKRGQSLDIEHIRQLMNMRIDRDLDLRFLADEARLSKYHFSRKFKELTGHAPIQHFIHLKMQYACQLLDSSTDPIKQIAAAVGFDDPYYFSRQFKQVIGLSPSQYREGRLT